MGEIKSVKVDNWGVFFLQKLQNFFNKTDYCDLTLQFNDNSQLKVHRLVLSACTDYFNVLEQTCDVVDDALIMPNELQADVVVPIVNFMYTGTLEFELKMYGKLLRTAKEMNMTVLLKLLEAHRRTMEGVNRGQRPASPKSVRKRGPIPTAANVTHSQIRPLANSSQQQQQQRRILTAANATAQRRLVQLKSIATNVSQSQVQQYRQPHGSASLLKPSTAASSQNLHRTTCEAASYTGDSATYEPAMQFKEEQHDDYETQLSTTNQSTSPFEQLRKGYNNNKRPASATFISPPAKKPNIEDVKEFAEQQRMRKQIAAEYGEDQEYESTMLDDDIHNDDDDDDTAAATSSSSIPVAPTPTITVRSQQQHQSGPSIIIKQEPNEKPTIVVKDISNSKMNHAKIISEVLRQYPHLVKSNKNIKLKIMPNAGGQSQKIIMKKEQISPEKNAQSVLATTGSGQTVLKPTSTQQKLTQPQQTQKLTSVAPVAAVETSASQTSAATTGAPTQKRRIDSKTMHALIALGAENMTGPWLCLRCGVNGRPISIPSYRGFRRHLINTHKEAIDPALCEHCGWRSTTNRELIFHIQVEHKIKTTMYVYPECLICSEVFLDTCALNQHMIDSHPEEDQQQCIYCNKIFAKELQLYTHMKTYHKMQAISDGIIDYSEDDDDDGEDEQMESQEIALPADCGDEKADSPSFSSSHINKKINILSDISLPSANSLMTLERPRSGAAALTKIVSGIAANIGLETSETETMNSEPKFVSADGNEMMLTDEQRKEIMSQLNQDHEGGVVMLLNESAFTDADAAVAATVTNEEASADESPDLAGPPANMEHETEEHAADTSTNEDDTSEYDDSNIYGEFVSKGDVENKKEAGLDESKGSNDNLEWAENLLTAHELEDEGISEGEPKQAEKVVDKTQNVNDRKTDKDISEKLKELTGDWSDDEIEEDDAEEEDEEEEVKPTPEISIHKDIEIEEKQNEVTEKTLNVVASKAMEQSPEEEEAQVKRTEKTEDTPGVEKMDCKQIEENEPEDDIDMALETLHKEVEIKIENVTPETDGAGASAGNITNVEESEDNNYNQAECKEEVLNKIDHSLGKLSELTSDKTSSLAEKTAIVTKNFEVKTAEKEEENIETDPHDKITCVKKDFPQEDDNKASVEESNLDMDIEMRDTATETKAVEVETNKDIVATEIAKEEPDVSTQSPKVTSKTEDKIKTLISEWGDDDDDEIEDVETLE